MPYNSNKQVAHLSRLNKDYRGCIITLQLYQRKRGAGSVRGFGSPFFL